MERVDVLLVEDSSELLALTSELVTGAGLTVATARDGYEALERLRSLEPHLILADVEMPRMDGYELCRSVRASGRADLPFLFLSGRGSPSERVEGLRVGADDYIVKPVDPQELVLKVTRLVERRRRHLDASGAGMAGPALRVAELEERLRERETSGGQAVRLGRYDVLEVLGRGGMGSVFRGWDPRLKRPVALKTLHAGGDLTSYLEGGLAARLLEEATMAARFNHPHIVAVHDVEDAPEAAFIVMELVEGVSLEDLLRRDGRLEAGRAVPMLAAMARALETAHAQGVLHRDVKPGNVLLGRDGAIKLTDFGIAAAVSSLVEASGQVFGTPGFIPPEVLRGEGFDETGDLWALGIVAHRCLTGERRVEADAEAPHTHPLEEGAASATAEQDPLPRELQALMQGLLQPRREDRPAKAALVAQELEDLAARQGWRWKPPAASTGTAREASDSGRPHARLLATTRLLA